MLTQKRLRQVLSYDSETGVFTWVRGSMVGKVAGTLHDSRGFLKVSIDGKRYMLHRLAWLWMTGAMPRSNVEHHDGNHSNNRWANLVAGDRMQKTAHREPRRIATDIDGVWSVADRFEAVINIDGQTLNIGDFATAEEAQLAITTVLRRARENQRRKLSQAV